MLNTSIGPTYDVAYSDWLHASIFVTGNGDIRVSYFQQFISGFIELQRRRKAVSLRYCLGSKTGFTEYILPSDTWLHGYSGNQSGFNS